MVTSLDFACVKVSNMFIVEQYEFFFHQPDFLKASMVYSIVANFLYMSVESAIKALTFIEVRESIELS